MYTTEHIMFIHEKHHIKPPKHMPSCGVHRDVAHTIANVRNCHVYVWLHNQREFWFFPVGAKGRYLDGYMWNRRRWVKTRINIGFVKSYIT